MSRKLIICVQQRYAPNPVCCANNGSLELLPLLQQTIMDMNVAVEVETSGCLGMCLHGPNFKLMPDGAVWNHVKKSDIAEIVGQIGKLAARR